MTEEDPAPLAPSAAFTLGFGQTLLFVALGSKLPLSLGYVMAAGTTEAGTLGGAGAEVEAGLAAFVAVETPEAGTALLVLVFVAGLLERRRSRLSSSSMIVGQPVCNSSMRFGLIACISSATGKAPDGSSSSMASVSASASGWVKSGLR